MKFCGVFVVVGIVLVFVVVLFTSFFNWGM